MPVKGCEASRLTPFLYKCQSGSLLTMDNASPAQPLPQTTAQKTLLQKHKQSHKLKTAIMFWLIEAVLHLHLHTSGCQRCRQSVSEMGQNILVIKLTTPQCTPWPSLPRLCYPGNCCPCRKEQFYYSGWASQQIEL